MKTRKKTLYGNRTNSRNRGKRKNNHRTKTVFLLMLMLMPAGAWSDRTLMVGRQTCYSCLISWNWLRVATCCARVLASSGCAYLPYLFSNCQHFALGRL